MHTNRMAHFSLAFQRLIKDEGGYSNHPNDSGGATMWGITHKNLSRWRKEPVSDDDVRNLTLAEAENIYKAWYWDPLNCDLIKSHLVAEIMFNFGVNMGIGTVAKMVQSIVGVNRDGKIGPISLTAINAREEKPLALEILKAVQSRYAQIVRDNPSQSVFILGWINRSHRALDLIMAEKT